MREPIASTLIKSLLWQHYALTTGGEPQLLNNRDDQSAFKVALDSGEALTLRLYGVSRPKERVMGGVRALTFLDDSGIPVPHLCLTLEGEPLFQWQPGGWGYLQEYIEGEIPLLETDAPAEFGPVLDRATLAEVGSLLGRLHNIAFSTGDYPVELNWLDELPQAVAWAKEAARAPEWAAMAAEIVTNLNSLPVSELKALPYGFLHSDMHEGNLIRTPTGRLFLLDWEDAGLDRAVIDVAMVLGRLCAWKISNEDLKATPAPELYIFNEEYCRAFLDSYQQERPLTEQEGRMLGPCIRYLMGWFSARDMVREIKEPGVSEGLAVVHWEIMRSVTPEWSAVLARWAAETALNQD